MALTGKVGGNFDLVPAGMHIARCIRVIDLGSVYNEKWGYDQRKVLVTFELPNEIITGGGEYDGLPRAISKRYTLSMSEKSFMRKDLESWRGKSFNKEDAENFDILKLASVPAMVNVIHTEDGKYANIATITPLPKGMECPPVKSDVFTFSLEAEDYTTKSFGKLSEKIQEQVMSSPEWKLMNGEIKQEEGAQQPTDGGFDPNDDVPF